MNPIPRTDLSQWAVLRTVIETGSFARAAEKLNRSQSSISYAVARLQEAMGVEILRQDGRKAILTAEGRQLLADAIPLIDDLIRIEQRGQLMARGEEAIIRLLVDAIYPKAILFEVLAQFQTRFPHTGVVLQEVVRRPADGEAQPFDLAILLWDKSMGLARRLLDIEMLAVAAAGHPLHQRGKALSYAALARFPGLVIEGPLPSLTNPAAGEVNGLQWRVNTVEAALATVRQGLCHGWLPRHVIADDIASGTLVPLPLAVGAVRTIPLVLNYADEEQAGPLTRALADLLIAASAGAADAGA